MNGRFAISTAGHDAGKIYIIVGEKEGRVLVADGIKYTIVNPKRKNAKHLNIPKQEAATELATMILENRRGCDEAIRQILHHLMKENLRYMS